MRRFSLDTIRKIGYMLTMMMSKSPSAATIDLRSPFETRTAFARPSAMPLSLAYSSLVRAYLQAFQSLLAYPLGKDIHHALGNVDSD